MVRQDMKSLSKYHIGDCRTFTRYRTIDIDMKKDLVKILVDTVCPSHRFSFQPLLTPLPFLSYCVVFHCSLYVQRFLRETREEVVLTVSGSHITEPS